MNPGVPTRGDSEPWSRADTIIVLGLMLVFGLLLTWSHGRMLHPIIDSGRDLYIPGQLLAGQKLYSDIKYFYPPLAPYLLAVVTAVIGRGLDQYFAIGLMASAVVAGSVFAIGRHFGGRWSGAAATYLVITWSLAGATPRGWNFFFPYAHAVTFGMMFFLVYMLLLARFLFSGGTTWSFRLALGAGLAASWTKIEFAVLVALTLGSVLLLRRFLFGDEWRRIVRRAALAVGTFAATIGTAELYFRGAPPGHHWFHDGVYWRPLIEGPIARRFYAQVMGLDNWRMNVFVSIASAILIGMITVAAAMFSRALNVPEGGKRYTMLAVSFVAVLLISIPIANQRFFRAWSVLQVVIGAIALVQFLRTLRDANAREAHLCLLFLLVFSLCCSSRIYLNLEPYWYGFAFIIPTNIFIAYVLFAYGPRLGLYSQRAALLWLIPVLLVGARGMQEQRLEASAKRFPVHTARGDFRDDVADRAAVLNQFLAYVGQRGAHSLVVMPEGIALNYFLDIPDPLSYNTFNAPEIATQQVERDVVREIETRKPELVALNNQYISEFGVGEFGSGYGRPILDDLNAHYAVERRWQTQTFSMLLLRRVR